MFIYDINCCPQYEDSPTPDPTTQPRGGAGGGGGDGGGAHALLDMPPDVASSIDFMDHVSQVRVVRPRRRHQVNHQHEPVNMLMGGKQVMLFER